MSVRAEKKDVRLAVCMLITFAIGLVCIILKENYILLSYYIPCSFGSVLALYFNYSMCKFTNRWRVHTNSEPSRFLLVSGKIAEWVVFLLSAITAALPAM